MPKTLEQIADEVEAEEATDRATLVSMLPLALKTKQARDQASKDYDKITAPMRRFLELGDDDSLYDGESGIEARLSPAPASHSYDVAEMPDELVIGLARAGFLSVRHEPLMKSDAHRLKDGAKGFYMRGAGTRRFSVEKVKE